MTNIFVLIFVPYLIWMLFFDENSYLTHRKFDKEINDLENTISFYKKKIEQDKSTISKLQDSLELERFAREKYLMKKENEDIYIIEFDTIK
jgi:cell division protein FtsB